MLRKHLTPRTISMSLMSLTLAIAPFFSGLYEDVHRYFFMAILLGLCAYTLALVAPRPLSIPRASIPAIALAAIYIIRIFFRPASYLGAVNGALIILTSVVLYLTWAALKPTDSERRQLCYAIIASAYALALAGLYQQVYASFTGAVLLNLTTGFGYKNATASWLVLGFILAVFLSQDTHTKWGSVLTVSTTPIIGAALVLTGSRGGWIVLAFTLATGFLLSAFRLQFLGQLIVIGIAALAFAGMLVATSSWSLVCLVAVSSFFIAFLVRAIQERHVVVGLVVITLVCALAGAYLIQRLNTSTYTLSNVTKQNRNRVISFAATGLEPITTYSLKTLVEVDNPSRAPYAATVSIWGRAEGVNTERLFYKAITETESLDIEFTTPAMINEVQISFTNVYPSTSATLIAPALMRGELEQVLKNVYHQILPYPIAYNVARLVALDSTIDERAIMFRDAFKAYKVAPLFGYGGGAWRAVYSRVQSYYYGSARTHSDPIEILLDVGVLGFAAYIVFLVASLLSIVFHRATCSSVTSSCALAFCAFAMHSAVEALIGFPVLYFATFTLLGVVAQASPPDATICMSKTLRRIAITVLALCACLALSFGAGELANSKGTPGALRLATLLNPLSPQHKVSLASVVPASSATNLLESAHRLEPYSAVFAAYLGTHYLAQRNYLPAIEALVEAIERQPMNITNYENAAFAAAEAATALYKTSLLESTAFAEQVLSVQQKFLNILSATDPAHLKRNPAFKLTPRLAVDIGRALAVLARKDDAWPYLMQVGFDTDGTLAPFANPWLRSYGYIWDPVLATNLVPTMQSFVGYGVKGYTCSRMAPLQAVDDVVRVGTASLKGEVIEAGGHGIGTAVFGPIAENTIYTASVYVRRDIARPMRLRLDWQTDLASNGNSYGSFTNIDDEWIRLTVTGRSPPGTTRVRLYIRSDTSGQPGDIVWADGWMLEEGPVATPWIPGQCRRIE